MRNGFCCKNNLVGVLLYRATFCMTWLCFHIGFFFFCLNFEKQNLLSSVLRIILMMSFSTARKSHFKFNCNQHTFVPPPSRLQNKNTPCYRAHSGLPCSPHLGYSSLQCTQWLPGMRQYCKI